jgi:hypothetical protein
MDRENETGGAMAAPPDARSLAARIRALPELSIGALRAAWTAAWDAPPPKGARRRLLMLGVAWKWQAEIHGGLPKPLAARLAALEAAFRQTGAEEDAAPGGSGGKLPRPGTRLIRIWRGERHEVQVTGSGYRWRGRDWRSLSAVAREITGCRRNGPAFFGLRDGVAHDPESIGAPAGALRDLHAQEQRRGPGPGVHVARRPARSLAAHSGPIRSVNPI